MDKRGKFGLYSIVILMLIWIIAEIAKPKPINWKDSYTLSDKIPLGCYVLFNELKVQYEDDLIINNQNLYNNLEVLEENNNASLLFINNDVYFDEQTTNTLLDHVNKGNYVFVSSSYGTFYLEDTLGYSIRKSPYEYFSKDVKNTFTATNNSSYNTDFKAVIETSYFNEIDTLQTTVLGYVQDNDEENNEAKEVNFIKVKYGDKGGAFYLHTNPYAFSNYHMLNKNDAYAATLLSYLPKNRPLIWDDYNKSGRKYVSSPLRYVLNQTTLKWALYITLCSLILYMIFRGKRTQRIIPVIHPLENASVQFTKTIGALYFQYKDYGNIIQKKTVYFLEFVRSNYYLNTAILDKNFIKNLAIKSGKPEIEIEELVVYMQSLQQKPTLTEGDLVALNKKLERFYKTN